MKKRYITPQAEIVSFLSQEVLQDSIVFYDPLGGHGADREDSFID